MERNDGYFFSARNITLINRIYLAPHDYDFVPPYSSIITTGMLLVGFG
jgi:hypothetical protein